MLLKKDNKEKIPDVEFKFDSEGKSKEEIKREIDELIKKRDEIYVKIINEVKDNDNVVVIDDYPRRVK